MTVDIRRLAFDVDALVGTLGDALAAAGSIQRRLGILLAAEPQRAEPLDEVAPAHRADTPDVAQDCTPPVREHKLAYTDESYLLGPAGPSRRCAAAGCTMHTPWALCPAHTPGTRANADLRERLADLEVIKDHLRTLKEEERAATFSDGTTATPQDLPFPVRVDPTLPPGTIELRGPGGQVARAVNVGVVTDTDRPDMQAKVLTPLPVDLGPPPLICDQDGCFADAVAFMTWPGSPPKPICSHHLVRAKGIATAMGFVLQVEDL